MFTCVKILTTNIGNSRLTKKPFTTLCNCVSFKLNFGPVAIIFFSRSLYTVFDWQTRCLASFYSFSKKRILLAFCWPAQPCMLACIFWAHRSGRSNFASCSCFGVFWRENVIHVPRRHLILDSCCCVFISVWNRCFAPQSLWNGFGSWAVLENCAKRVPRLHRWRRKLKGSIIFIPIIHTCMLSLLCRVYY